jgi:hypothetical protein
MRKTRYKIFTEFNVDGEQRTIFTLYEIYGRGKHDDEKKLDILKHFMQNFYEK